MFLLKQVLPSAVLATAVAGAIAAIALLFRKEGARTALLALAVALGYAAGHFLIAGLTKLPPADTTNWLPYCALAAASAVAAGQLLRAPWLRWALYGLVAACALRLLLAPMFRHAWSPGIGWSWIGCLSVTSVLLTVALNAVRRAPSLQLEMPAYLVIVSGATAGALLLGGSLLLAQYAAVLAGSSLAPYFATSGERAAAVWSLVFVALLVSGYAFAELPLLSAVFLGVAPVLALLPIRMTSAPGRVALRLALVSTPLIVALILTFRSSPPLEY